jgi:serine/threonine protein kinase
MFIKMDTIIMIDTTWKIQLKDLEHVLVITEHENVTLYKSIWRTFQEVCVKRIKVTTSNHKYVQREFDTLKICAHPCVYQFYGGCVEISENNEEYAYFLFEYMENGNLSEYMRTTQLTYPQKCEIIRRIAIGMHYLYSRKPINIIHRDFKPENILVNRHGEVKIADFGISKQMLNESPGTSPSGAVVHSCDLTYGSIGTVRWSAPEILYPKNGERYSHLSDIYSLGLLIYFVFTNGDVPYWKDYQNNYAKIVYAKHNNIRTFLSDIDDDPVIQDLVTRCTERDPELRLPNPDIIIRKMITCPTRSCVL